MTKKSIRELIDAPVLSERERRVLEMRYFQHKTLREIGEVFGVTRERVRQIEASAFRQIRQKHEGGELR